MAPSPDRRSVRTRPQSHSRNLVLVNNVDPDRGRSPEAISVLIASGGKLARAGLRALLDADRLQPRWKPSILPDRSAPTSC